jgi:hypothetical protein
LLGDMKCRPLKIAAQLSGAVLFLRQNRRRLLERVPDTA